MHASLIEVINKIFAVKGINRAMQQEMLSCLDGVGLAAAKRIASIFKIMAKFVFTQVTKT